MIAQPYGVVYMILKQNGENLLAMVGIKDIKLMSVLHQKVLYCRMHLQQRTYMIAPALLRDIQNQNVLFSVADAAYDNQYIYEIAGACNIFARNPINPRVVANKSKIHIVVYCLILHKLSLANS